MRENCRTKLQLQLTSDRLQVGANLAGVLVAASRFLFQRVQDHFIQTDIYGLGSLRGQCETAQGQLAGQHFIKNHAQRIKVSPMIHQSGRFDLFGGNVMRGAHDRGGQRRASRALSVLCSQFGQAKIRDFNAPFFVKQNIRGLDVAMDDAFLVRILQGLANLKRDAPGFVRA
jgi:hypothetical protein